MGLLVTSSRRGFFATLAALPAVVMGRKAIAAPMTVEDIQASMTPAARSAMLAAISLWAASQAALAVGELAAAASLSTGAAKNLAEGMTMIVERHAGRRMGS